jgi:ubiquinone/menaquinone biosynthesis C-methylase UbiE
MILRILHFIVAIPWVYDLVQKLAGREEGHRHMRPFLSHTAGQTVLEVGAGTGDWAQVLPPTARYIWFDNDAQKLSGFRRRDSTASLALLGDASQMCIRQNGVDWAICIAVSHHLTDAEFRSFLSSLAHVSKNGLIFMDGLRRPDLPLSQLLWHYDRGAYPRPFEELRPFLTEFFDIVEEKRFTVYHEHWVCNARPKAALHP